MGRRVLVIGAGVIGLTCAVRLSERGHEVAVLARDLPGESTSALAGGLWLPHPAVPGGRVAAWATASLAEFTTLAADEATGVRLVEGQVLHRTPVPAPAWATAAADRLRPEPVIDPAPGFGSGLRLRVPLVDPRRYLPYLRERLGATGGTVTRMALTGLPPRGVVVNCTGLAARALVPDPSVRPLRGQLVVVSNPGLAAWRVHLGGPEDLRYVLPTDGQVLVGGTAEDGIWDLAPDPGTAERLLARAREIAPELDRAEVVGHRVGLRPAREEVRIEAEHAPTDDDPDRRLVHCYGHGGSGLTLSWGCADEVVSLVGEVTGRSAGDA